MPKENKALYNKVKSVVLLLMGVLLAVLIYLSASLATRLYSNNNEINAKARNGAMADARKIDKMAGGIERTVKELALAIGGKGVDEKRAIDILSTNPSGVPGRYSVRFFSKSDSMAVCRGLSPQGFARITRMMDVSVPGKSDAKPGSPQADSAALKDGWQKASWHKSEKAMILAYEQRIYAISPSGKSVPVGVVSARLSADDFQKSTDNKALGEYGYRFLVDGDGMTLDHPDKNLIVNNFDLLNYAKKTYRSDNCNNLLNAFTAKTAVSICEKDLINKQKSVIRFEPVASTGWYAGVSLLIDDLSLSDTYLKQQLMLLLSVLMALLLITGLYVVLFAAAPAINFPRRLSFFSWFSSGVFISGLMCMWALQITRGTVSPYEDNCITTTSQVEQYKKDQAGKAQLTQSPSPQFIQTGIMVNSVSVSEPNGTADIYGTLWQRIPSDADPARALGVLFPDQIETKMYEIYRVEENGYKVVGWNFATRLQQDFRSSMYPFDRITVQIRMRQPKKFESIVLIPDIASYKITAPSAKSMVPADFSISGWNHINTYFNFSEQSQSIDYGRRELVGAATMKDLVLKITLERDWITIFISVMIPIFIILIILYSGVYMITNDLDTRESFNFDAKEATAIGSAFTIFLVISMQSVRTQLAPSGILYVEKIYFMIYFAMLVNVILVIFITKQKGFLFRHKHGIFFRYLYWPLYSCIFFMITLITFY
ncbi:MAG: hypothetical protein HGB04_01005 [Chlorobiaceae bacterium]|nr:hypothetical protein [Chlorobiaceae bacterium]